MLMYDAMVVAFRSLVALVLIGVGVAQSPFCPAPNGDFPNPASETCFAYFRCYQGQPVALRCPSEQTFDFLRLACRPQDEVDCERQLELFATPPEFLKLLFGAGQNGLGFLNGQNGNQISPDPLSFQANPQQSPFAAGAQSNINGLQGNNFQANGSPAGGLPDNVLSQGILGANNPFSNGVLIQGTQPVEGAVPAVGRLYPTAQGTVIVIPKQPGQPQIQLPNIQRVDTVTVSITPAPDIPAWSANQASPASSATSDGPPISASSTRSTVTGITETTV